MWSALPTLPAMVKVRAGFAGTGSTPVAAQAGQRMLTPVRVAILLLVVSCLVYANSISGAFVFDDNGAIIDNPTIRTLWPPTAVLSPPIDGLPVTGRPITNLSFALNYAIHGLEVRGYHAVNLAIHVCAGLLLFGVVRRTLARHSAAERECRTILVTAGSAVLLWLVHPLQTGAVTYISQRAESLASACILLALYAFIRGVDSARPARWHALVVAACWIGIGTKEIVGIVPLLLAAYHAVFLSDSWRQTWREQRWVLLATAASWLPLLWLIAGTENRGGTWAGAAGFTPWEYLRIQCAAVLHYLRLVVWPAPLVFDYGRNLDVPTWIQIAPQAVMLVLLVCATAYGLARRMPLGFLGLAFFGLLAPSSSVVPLADAMFEHRMYLASAVVIVGLVVPAGLRLGCRVAWLVVPFVVALGVLTVDRNSDFASPVRLWEDTVAKRPTNARALGNLGQELMRAGRLTEAVPYFERACQVAPDTPLHPHNLAVALDLAGRKHEAIAWYRRALELQPRNFLARTNLAGALAAEGDTSAAFAEFERVLADSPDFVDAHRGYGRALLRAGRTSDAVRHFGRAIELRPADADAQFNLGDALARGGRLEEARDAFLAATRLDPAHAAAWSNLGNARLLLRDPAGAIEAFEKAINLKPDAVTHANLGYAFLLKKRPMEAQAQFTAALALDPNYVPARRGLTQLQGGGSAP